VKIEQEGATVSGPILKLNLVTNLGEMAQPEFVFIEPRAHGSAQMVHFEGKGLYAFDNASYTTCPMDNDGWFLKAHRLELDRNTQVGVAHSATIEFQGVPFMYTPWMDFPLGNDRRSGFLGPVYGNTTNSGTEITLPYYLNLAPNMDATMSPRIMSRRGTQLNNEFRFLEPNYRGEVHVDLLPNDRIQRQSRDREMLKYSQNLGGGLGLLVNLNRVSDDNYFRDLSDTIGGTSQVILPREGALTYSGGWWNTAVRVQSFQTLEDPLAPIAAPYNRLPQISFTGNQAVLGGGLNIMAEYVDFWHPTAINSQRAVLYPSLTLPLLSDPAMFLTPKLGIHETHYVFGDNNNIGMLDANRVLPIFSLDSGLIFERESNLAGVGYTQTLEPRAYYVNVPYHNQDALPVFDTSQAALSFSQLFSDNRFFGSDRVGDTNSLTLATTTRFIDNDAGLERLRIMVGERFNFVVPQVNLVALPGPTNKSDILLGLSGRLTKKLTLDSLLQYNPSQQVNDAYNVNLRYRAEAGHVLNLGYRYTNATSLSQTIVNGVPYVNGVPVVNVNGVSYINGVSVATASGEMRQLDVSAQWPLFGKLYAVARWNYSILDQFALESMLGLEYNTSCWAMRMVAQTFTTSLNQSSSGLFIQLDLTGLGGIGADPLDALRRSVFGYSKMNVLPADQPTQGLR
jgi:LPS-assembly protein